MRVRTVNEGIERGGHKYLGWRLEFRHASRIFVAPVPAGFATGVSIGVLSM